VSSFLTAYPHYLGYLVIQP